MSELELGFMGSEGSGLLGFGFGGAKVMLNSVEEEEEREDVMRV